MKRTIALMVLVASLSAVTVEAGISLEQQRIDRERSEQRRHEIEIEKIRAQALIDAAKYNRRRCEPTIIYRRSR